MNFVAIGLLFIPVAILAGVVLRWHHRNQAESQKEVITPESMGLFPTLGGPE